MANILTPSIRRLAVTASPSHQLRVRISDSARTGFATYQRVHYPRQVTRRTTAPPTDDAPPALSVARQDQYQKLVGSTPASNPNDELPWYLREQESHNDSQEPDQPARRAVDEGAVIGLMKPDAKLPPALKGLHKLLTAGPASPLIQRPDEGELDSETQRRPLHYIHARKHDEQSWTDWVVVVQVKSSSSSTVARVARAVGEYLEQAPPPTNAGSIPTPAAAAKAARKEEQAQRSWRPYKILSRDAQDGLRLLHAQDPERWSRKALAETFKMSVESVRRILKSNWQPSSDVVARQNRRAHERQQERQAQFSQQGWQGREDEEIERIRASMAESNAAEDGPSGAVHNKQNSEVDLDDYRVVDEDGNLVEETSTKQSVRYEGLVGPSSSGEQASMSRAKARGARSGIGRGDGEWCLVDAGWCVVHVMTAKARLTYDVEQQYV